MLTQAVLHEVSVLCAVDVLPLLNAIVVGCSRERQREGRGVINKGPLKQNSASFRLLIKPDKSRALKKTHSTATLSPQKGFLSQHALQEPKGENRDKGS